jgi:histidyl-tRNA synthetase
LYDVVFTALGLKGVTLKLNHRKVLSGFAEIIGAADKLVDFTVALDKMDKIGEEGVVRELLAKGIGQDHIEKVRPLFSLGGSNEERLHQLEALLKDSQTGLEGVRELSEILVLSGSLGLDSLQLQLEVTLARGLDYYTGAIFEVASPDGTEMGSIGGGGRYDDLTGIFGMRGVSGVGISFGLDRIYLVMEALDLFPETLDQSLRVLCVNFGEREAMAAFVLVKRLREKGIAADVYPTATKIQKQFKYADIRNVPYVVLIGEEELNSGKFLVRDMKSGEQQAYSLEAPEAFFSRL